MRRALSLLPILLLLGLGALHAAIYPPSFSTSQYVTLTQLQAVQNAIPQPAASVPSPGTLPGSAGSASTYLRGDAAIPLTVQRTTVTTDASGNWSVTWSKAFVSSSPTVNPIAMNVSATSPFVCNVTTRSSTAATGKCWQLAASGTVALISLNVSLAPTPAPTTTSVMLIGAEPTQ